MKDCNYPKCEYCEHDDCIMDNKDIHAMLKRRRWNANPAAYQQKQRDYRNRISKFLPHCDECENCVLVKKDKGEGFRRLCVSEMRLIEQKVSNSPQWCKRRTGNAEKQINNHITVP